MGIGGAGIVAINAMRMAQENANKCPHCGKQLPDKGPPLTGGQFVFIAAFVIVAAFVFIGTISTLADWFDSDKTLIQVAVDNMKWLWHLLGRIW